jgi:4-alpha-glucanotransferase
LKNSNGSKGKWRIGPGGKILDCVKKSIGSKPIIAEDLGEATAEAKIIRDQYDIPGMKILQMAFGGDNILNGSLPGLEQENIVIYTGTHDNDTTIGWFDAKPGKGNTQSIEEIELERKNVLKLLGTNGSEINWDFISLAMQSKANTVIIPMQDILGLDSSARMNTPGTIEGNWEWRYEKNQLTIEIIKRMKRLTKESNRLLQV